MRSNQNGCILALSHDFSLMQCRIRVSKNDKLLKKILLKLMSNFSFWKERSSILMSSLGTPFQVVYSASLLKSNDKAYEALMVAMRGGAPVEECVAAIEGTT